MHISKLISIRLRLRGTRLFQVPTDVVEGEEPEAGRLAQAAGELVDTTAVAQVEVDEEAAGDIVTIASVVGEEEREAELVEVVQGLQELGPM